MLELDKNSILRSISILPGSSPAIGHFWIYDVPVLLVMRYVSGVVPGGEVYNLGLNHQPSHHIISWLNVELAEAIDILAST